ncbi:uncharacterized protein LOC125781104 [Astyanax mexicanus]|uniref:uncharacterized protein LOC125781104 n=1 Tax=Astyanax mexicanus TaxID=7994 RepID=UPI0020CAC2C0|nr:uncharacterized protein LOC125781104 [Astyanax mexicanus]
MRTLLLLTLVLGTIVAAPDVISPGPTSGVVLRDNSGLLITNCRLHTQRVFVRLNPEEVCKKNFPDWSRQVGWAGHWWVREAVSHAERDTTHMLQQLQKFAVTQSELNGAQKRSKRFLAGLLTAAAAVGSLLGVGTSAVNAVGLATVRRNVGELQAELPHIKDQIDTQQRQLQAIGQTLQGTIVVLNTHTVALNKTLQTITSLTRAIQTDMAHIQVINMLLNDMLQEVGSSVDSLAMGKIPAYLVPLTLVQEILSRATREEVTDLQAHLAYTLGSAVPLYVNPENREVAFLVNLPIIAAENIYRLKEVVNVGFWQKEAHIKIQTPTLVAYQDSNPGLYLAPNLRMCTLSKDIHYLCPSKPFTREGAGNLCGLKPMLTKDQCPATVTHRYQQVETQVEIVGSRWLVNTAAREAVLSYDQHDIDERIPLPEQTFWVDVPPGATLHVGEWSLYHLVPDQYESEIEVSDFFTTHSLELSPDTLGRIQYEGPQSIDLTPINNVLKEIESRPTWTVQPVRYSWSLPDTLLAALVCLGYVATFGITCFYRRKTVKLQRQMDSWSGKVVRFVRRRRGGQEVSVETQEDATDEPMQVAAVREVV